MNNPCMYSAHIFLVNAALCACVCKFRYAYAFLALYVTSILYHSNYGIGWIAWVDKCAIGAVVLLGLCKFVTTNSYGLFRSCCIVGACIACMILHFFGITKSDLLHALLIHGSTFVGHVLICL
jgi:uncharacterized membrane protein YeaQ/YmgE (transglycosylase-associated protein family)